MCRRSKTRCSVSTKEPNWTQPWAVQEGFLEEVTWHWVLKDERALARQREDHILGKESNTCRGLVAEEKKGHAGRDSNLFSGVIVVQPEWERSVRMRLWGKEPAEIAAIRMQKEQMAVRDQRGVIKEVTGQCSQGPEEVRDAEPSRRPKLVKWGHFNQKVSSVQFSRSVVSNSLPPHGL